MLIKAKILLWKNLRDLPKTKLMKDIVIYGAGSVGRFIEQIISDINSEKHQYNFLGYLDDDSTKYGSDIFGYEVLGGMDWIDDRQNVYIALGFSNPIQKFELIKKMAAINFKNFVSLIHPQTWISKRVDIGIGAVIYPGAHIEIDVKIGSFALLNMLCTIGHDCTLGNFVTISPGVNIGGYNNIEDGVEFGINSCSIQKISIGKWSVIGAGTTIIKDVPDGCTVVGNPGRILKK